MYRYRDRLFKNRETAKKFYTKHLHKYYANEKFNSWEKETEWLEENDYKAKLFTELSPEELIKVQKQILDEFFLCWENDWLEDLEECPKMWDEEHDDLTKEDEELYFSLDN